MWNDDSDGFGLHSDEHGSIASAITQVPTISILPQAKSLPAPSGVDHSYFQHLHLRQQRSSRLGVLPWERGFAAKLMGVQSSPAWPFTDPTLRSLVIAADRAETVAQPLVVQTIPTCVSATAHRRVKFLKHKISPDALRQRALLKWRMIVESDMEATVVGQQMLGLIESLAEDNEVVELLANVFDPKKTGTLVKRVSAILSYVTWARSKAVFRPLLFDEQAAYAYARSLMIDNAAPTKASSFKQSVVFYRHLLGCPSADAAISSTRFRGCCARQFKKKRKLKQADELKVHQLRIFESLCTRAPSDADRCAAGFFTFCTLASSRCHDAMSSEKCTIEAELDGSCTVILGTADAKTSTTEQLQTQLLPLMAFSPGLLREDSQGWAQGWMDARKNCGLEFGPGKPVLPALGSDDKFLERAATSSELISWMNELLRMGGDSSAKVSTHACKRAVLVWSAKYGMPLEDRRVLGHHAHPTIKSVLTYSKEALAGPMAMVWNMFTEILAGTFDPESSAISRISKRKILPTSQAVIPPEVDLEIDAFGDSGFGDFEFAELDASGGEEVRSKASEEGLEVQVSVSSASNSSDSSSDSSSDLLPEDVPDIAIDDAALEAAGFEPVACTFLIDGHDTFQHRSSGVLHYRSNSNATKFVCGRILSAVYTRILCDLKYDWPKCQICLVKASA